MKRERPDNELHRTAAHEEKEYRDGGEQRKTAKVFDGAEEPVKSAEIGDAPCEKETPDSRCGVNEGGDKEDDSAPSERSTLRRAWGKPRGDVERRREDCYDPTYHAKGFSQIDEPARKVSIQSRRLYFAVRSLRHTEPVLICPHPIATARSAIEVSSVSPDR